MKRSLAMAGLLLGTMLAGAGLDKGGVTFDFRKISAGLFKPAQAVAQADNLVTNADGKAALNPKDNLRWQGNYCYLHTREIADKDPRRAQVRKMVKWTIEDGVFKVVKPAQLNDILPVKVVKSTSGGWRKAVNLPDDKGGRYILTFQYRATVKGAGGCCLIVSGYTERAGKWWKAKEKLFKIYSLRPSSEWQNYRNEILIPPGLKSLQIVWRIDGVGSLDFRTPALVAASGKGTAEKLNLRLSPMASLDQTFALAQGIPGTMVFVWKRNGAPAEAKLVKPELVAVLPKEITYYESAGLKLLSKKEVTGGIEYRIDLRGRRERPALMESYDFYLRHSLLISTQAAPGAKLADGSAWVEENGVRLSNVEKVKFKVIPAFKAAKAQYYMPGIYMGGIYCNYTGDNMAVCAQMYDAAGVRWIVGGQNSAFPAWRKAGVKYITPELFFIANGFRVGIPKGRPEADKYRAIGTHNLAEFERSTCPAAVYEKRPFYMNSTVPYINKSLAGADGLWANWEPYGYAGRGCFCDTCRKKFAKFVGVSEEQMKKEWPQELAMGRKYYKQAVRFRSLEHAKLMHTVNEAVTAATGGEKSLGFIPGVQVDNMSSTWRQNGFDKETHPIDYAGKFRWIDPWGPYAFWNSFTPFVYSKSFNLRTFVKARDVREAVNKDYAPNPPKLLAFPHGLQGSDWVTQPESMAIELLGFMFNGWEASTVYAFPKGYDARYWKAFADASDIAARYDKYVFTGKRIDGRVTLTPLQPYAADTAILEGLLGTHKTWSMLQHTAYQLKDTVIVAAFNFWRDGEVFFKCQVKGLEPKVRYTVKHHAAATGSTRFVRKDGSSFTGADLEKGVMLHAGAVRCVVYEIAPEKLADKKIYALDAAAMAKFREEARPALLKAKAADEQYEKLYGIKESKLEDIANAGIVCKADPKANTLTFTSGKNTAVMNVPTFLIKDWTTAAGAVITGNRQSGVGAVAFWLPSCQIRSGFAVTAQKKIPGGLEITGEKRMLDRDNPSLAGLTIRQTFKITDNLKKIAVNTVLVNESDRNLTFGVRYNLIPAPPGTKGGFTQVTVNGKLTDFKRDFSRKIFSTGTDKQYETAVRKLFSVKSETSKIDAGPVYFRKPGLTVKLLLEPKAAFAGAAVWDSGRQAAGTFEPCFKFLDLGPGGKSFAFSSVMSIE